MTFNGL